MLDATLYVTDRFVRELKGPAVDLLAGEVLAGANPAVIQNLKIVQTAVLFGEQVAQLELKFPAGQREKALKVGLSVIARLCREHKVRMYEIGLLLVETTSIMLVVDGETCGG